jgi:hypothetical protein
VNSHGIAMTLTPVESNESRADGLPSAMVARMALQQSRTLDEALAILEDAKLACCPWDAILADKERAVLVARGLDNMAVREAVDGAVWAADSYGVRDKLARLAAEKPHTGEGVQEALVDCGEPDPICACGIGDGAYVFGAVVRPRARVIRLAAGEPCKTEFRPFQLKLAVTGAGSHLAGEYQQ